MRTSVKVSTTSSTKKIYLEMKTLMKASMLNQLLKSLTTKGKRTNKKRLQQKIQDEELIQATQEELERLRRESETMKQKISR